MNKIKQFAIPLAIIALVLLTIYKVFGEESIPTPEQIAQEQHTRLLEEQSQIDRDNLKILAYCNEYASGAKADERQKAQYDCYRTQRIPDIVIPELKASSGATSTVPPKELDELFKKVCDAKPSSPVCDRATFDRLYKITEERIPGKNFFPILLGITNAESSLGTAYAKNNKGGFCTGYNNLGGIKYRKTDDGKSIRDQKIPDANGCYLYKFESIDDYWISKVNTVRYGYKGCINSITPIRCMSFAYVGDRNVAEQSWIDNTSIFLK